MSRKPPSTEAAGSSQSRNEYIPSFISKKPFYIDDSTTDADYLEHQRLQSAPKDTLEQSRWYDRGRKLGPAATKFRKGACENCGAMTHKTKDCLSRPRKQGAKWTGRDIQADEVVEDVSLGWDAKRDRWNGYDAREYGAVVKEYGELEALKRATKSESAQKRLEDDDDDDGDGQRPDEEEAKYGEETDMGRNQPTSTRNLRLREDTAKYLLNLDLDSAKYDPKTRSMLDMGTLPSNGDSASRLVAEDNFMRASGDAAEFERAQRYAWESQEKGVGRKLHLQANPTEGEILRKKQTEEAESKKGTQRKALLEKYGGAEHLQPAPLKELQVLENERYVEYDESGAVKGETRKIARSKYAEDVFFSNHTSVWGSWWSNFQWGYHCCHSTVKNSYCTGEQGKKAFEQAEEMRMGDLLLEDAEAVRRREAQERRPESETEQKVPRQEPPVAKKRTLQEMREGISEEDLEAYKRNRSAADDPMAALLGKDELVH